MCVWGLSKYWANLIKFLSYSDDAILMNKLIVLNFNKLKHNFYKLYYILDIMVGLILI
jgi:hypothetical protein